ncbi:hypothetical protein MLD38_009455 [Melastoma candidum]|uniref:Uncharacterized protein n=1 Tax=Melastoma candidum TaxID=119954 RepID=A0ACB9S1Z0_9MYRT|nr:hypothetical protein MLD38_009455 [Melastoma candidum]
MACLRAMSLLMFVLAVVSSAAEQENRTAASGGLFSSTAKEEADLLRKEEPAILDDGDDIDGGFSSLDGMLRWAIGHSDPTKLKETAQDVQMMPSGELKKRQMELKELMEKMKMPSDAHLMQIAIDDLNNTSSSLEDRQRALQELLILVESRDNANDLNKLGGSCRVQKQVLELGTLAKLMMMVKSEFVEEAIKALHAVSAVVRNNLSGQELFYAEAGDLIIQDILSNSTVDVRLQRKAVFLVGYLAECQSEAANEEELPLFRNRKFLKSVVDLMSSSSDLDVQGKALVAVKNLLLLRSTDAQAFKEFCGLDMALERMRQQRLDHLREEEFQKDYAADVEFLVRDVELTLRKKVGIV